MLIIKKILFYLCLGLNIILAGNNFTEPVSYKIKLDNKVIRSGEVLSVLIDLKIAKNFYIYSSNPERSLSPSEIEWEDSSFLKL